ncbi:MAG: dihydrodipicolinate synthase family protein [Pseudomonadota bacterium]
MGKFRDIHIWSAPVTPFTADDRVDLDGFASTLDVLIDEGAQAIVLTGSIGEHAVLNDHEWSAILETARLTVGGRVPILTTAASPDPRIVQQRVAQSMEAGVDAVMVLPPYYFPLSRPELIGFYETVASWSAPFLTYSNPTTAGATLDDEALAVVAAMDNFVGHKEATPNPAEFHRKRKIIGPDFPLIAAAETQLAYILLAGANGVLTLLTTAAPQAISGMWHAADAGDFDEVMRRNGPLMIFRRFVDRINAQGSPAYLPVAKAILDWRGLAGGTPRPPIRPLNDRQRDELDQILREVLAISPV